MATERRAPEDLQEAVAATLRRLRGELGTPGQASAPRREPALGPVLTGPGAPFVASPPAAFPSPAQPDLLSRAEPEHEIPPNPSARLAELRNTLAKPEPAERAGLRLLPYMLSMLAVAAFAGIGWWAYKSISGAPRNGEVPVVAASQTPEKVPPPADQTVDTSTSSGNKTVYNEVAPGSAPEPKTEVLLAPPEAPQLPPATDTTAAGTTATPPATTTDTGSTTGSGSTSSATTGSTGAATSSDQSDASTGATTATGTTSSTASTAPSTTGSTATATDTQSSATNATATTSGSSGMTETLIPGSSTSSTSTAAPASVGSTGSSAPATAGDTTGQNAASSVLPGTTTTSLPAAPLTVESTPPATTTSTDNTTSAASTAAATATTAATAPASPTATQTASLGDFRIQLASLKTEAAAKKTWKRLSTKYKDVLASLTVHIEKVALSSGTFYRLQAGPFQDKAAAADACAKLKVHGQQCLVKP